MPASLKRLAIEDGSVSPPPTKRKTQTTVTSTVVANFFKPASQKQPDSAKFQIINGTLLTCTYDKPDVHSVTKPCKIAGFDFDSTLITSRSGKRFAHDAEDWKWWDVSVPIALRKLAADGYLVAILSNQGGIGLDPTSKKAKSDQKRLAEFKHKVKAVLHQLDIPITLYAATGKDKYRKPRTGMWDTLIAEHGLKPSDVDLQASFFVGDAGGRTSEVKGTKADFSCSDRDLADNLGIKFHTPEEYFLGEEARPFRRSFDPSTYLASLPSTSNNGSPVEYIKKHPLELVIFCGSPGAGKSTFFWQYLEPLGYQRVNQDILKTRDRCIQAATRLLEDGKSVAVDNTNADIDTRAHWIKLSAKFGIPVRCVHFTAPAVLCQHNDALRALSSATINPENREMLPKMAFTGFTARYREPSLAEGFEDIAKIDFKFTGTEDERLSWGKFWT